MARHMGPRSGTAAHRVLCRLVDLGGRATEARLKEILSREYRTNSLFQVKVTDTLLMFGLVTLDDGRFVATKAGKNFVAEYLGEDMPAPVPYVGQVAMPRVARKSAPLNMERLRFTAPIRPGAFEYRQHPSLMGVTRKLLSGEVVG